MTMHVDRGDEAGTTEEATIAAPFSKDEPPVGTLLYDRLARDWDNCGEIDAICQFELDGPGGGAFHLQLTPEQLIYHEGLTEAASARIRMPAAKARDLAIGANVNFHDRSHFAHMEVDGDPAVLAALAQSTLVPNREASARHAEAEARAARLPALHEPLRMKEPSAADVSEAIEAGIPLLIDGTLGGWEEARGWTFASIRRQFAHVTVRSTLGVTTLGEFLDQLETADAGPVPYTLGAVLPSEWTGYFPPPFFEPASFGPAQYWMGSGPNQVATVLHRDCGDAFLGQLIGRKRFRLYSPDQTPYLYVHKSYDRDQPCWVDPWEPDLDRFPLFAQATAVEFLLEPGWLLVIPHGWYHTVLALDRTLSVGFHRET